MKFLEQVLIIIKVVYNTILFFLIYILQQKTIPTLTSGFTYSICWYQIK